jgi:hypothetical protein
MVCEELRERTTLEMLETEKVLGLPNNGTTVMVSSFTWMRHLSA